MPRRTRRRRRRSVAGSAIVAAVGFVWRLALLVVDKWDQELLFNDSIYYSEWAKQLTEGRFFREVFNDLPTAEHGPLTSVLMVPFSWMDDPVAYQRLVTVICGTVTIVVIGLLGRAVRGDRVGIVAAVDRRGVREPVDQRRSGDVGERERARA